MFFLIDVTWIKEFKLKLNYIHMYIASVLEIFYLHMFRLNQASNIHKLSVSKKTQHVTLFEESSIEEALKILIKYTQPKWGNTQEGLNISARNFKKNL